MGDLNIHLGIFLLVFAFTLFSIGLYSFKVKDITGKNTFAIICICAAIYSFGYAMELFSGSPEKIIFWTYIEYIGIPLIPPFWLIFALQYCGKSHILSPKTFILIFIIPIITMILRFTNNWHHLFYINITFYNNGLFNIISLQKGPWYFVNFIYASIVELLSSYLYWQLFFKTNNKMRSQALIMFFASIFPWISTIIITLSKAPYGLDIGPFTLTISSLLFLLGLFKFNFLYLKPIARDKVFEWSDDGIIILDFNYTIIDFNASASKIIPVLNAASIGKDVKKHLIDYSPILNSIMNLCESQFKMQSSNNYYYYSIKCSTIFDNKNDTIGYLIFLHDITSHVNTMEKLNSIVHMDELTGVFNRRHFTELSKTEISRARRYNHPLCYIILDLDFFKLVNDKFGHLAGDEVLKNVSRICRKSIRSSDVLGRFGGEEFVILLPETRIEEATILAKRVCKSIESSEIIYNGQKINVTASLGVSGTKSVKDEDLNTFLKFADQALYSAKADGRNCVRSFIL